MNLGDQERLRRWLAQVGVTTMICLSITAPAIVISSSIPYFKVEQLLVPLVLAVYLWLLLAGVAHKIRLNGMFLVGLFYFICNIISIAYGAKILGHTVDLRDFYELPKVWLPVAFFTIAYEAELSESELRRLVACFSVAAMLVCFYGWAQFFGLGFTYKLNSYYSGGGHIDSALEYARRVYATVGNANSLGALMAWCVVIFVLSVLFRIGNRVYYSLIAFSCLATLVMTGSRYAMVSLSIGLILILVLVSAMGRRNLSKIALALLLLPLVLFVFQAVATSNLRTEERYQTFKDPLQIDSLRQRLDYLWPIAWEDFSRSPIVGHGPGKSFLSVGIGMGGVIDSEYLDVLREQGTLGLLAFLGYYLYPLYLIRKGLRAARRLGAFRLEQVPANIVVLQASFIVGVLALIINVGMTTFYTPFLQGFLWLWLGIGAGSAATFRESVALANASLAMPSFEPQGVS